MATTAPFVKLLRQLSGARDDYRTGALDISWEGGKATIFLVFGQPNHAVLDLSDGHHLEGQAALGALVNQLPARFQVSPWRKEVGRSETLKCSLEELMEPFAQLAGTVSAEAGVRRGQEGGEPASAGARIEFGLGDFPLLPLGTTLWADASASVVHLDVLIPNLPDALVVLTGSQLRAAGVIVHHRIIDAVWIDDEDKLIGDAAAMALLGATQGTVSGYQLGDPDVAEALTMLWRLPIAYRALPAAWVDGRALLADLERRRRDCAMVVAGSELGVALISAGRLMAVYTERDRQPVASTERLLALLRAPGARLTLRQGVEEGPDEQLPEESFHAYVQGAEEVPTEAGQPGSPGAPHEPSEPASSGSRAETAAVEPGEAEAVEAAPEAGRPGPEAESTLLKSVPSLAGAAPDTSPWLAALREQVLGASPGEAPPPPLAPPPVAAGAEAWLEPPATEAVDFTGVKRDLVQIGTLWLGSEDATEAIEMIERARPTVEDIMSTIDAIRNLTPPGHEPSVVQAMAREMRFHAAEHLSGL